MKKRKKYWTGRIVAVDFHGTVVAINIVRDNGETVAVRFKHRLFEQLLQCERCLAVELPGRKAVFDGGDFFFTYRDE